MQFKWMPTNDYYHRILDTPDAAARQQIYLDCIVQPWKPMMAMMGSNFNVDQNDPLAGARGWNWLLPDQTEVMAGLLAKLEAVNAWQIGRDALAKAVSHFEPYASRITFETVTGWLLLADPARGGADKGYTGATDWAQPQF